MGKSTLFAQGPIMTRAQMVCQNSMCTSSPRLAPASPPSPPRRLSSTPPPTARFDAWPPLLKWRAGLPAMCTSCGRLLPSLCRWRADTGRGDADPPPLPAPASSPSTLRKARCALLLPRTHRSREERQVHTPQGAAHRARDAKTKTYRTSLLPGNRRMAASQAATAPSSTARCRTSTAMATSQRRSAPRGGRTERVPGQRVTHLRSTQCWPTPSSRTPAPRQYRCILPWHPPPLQHHHQWRSAAPPCLPQHASTQRK